jgi:SNF2 family DNA or RNA helicase
MDIKPSGYFNKQADRHERNEKEVQEILAGHIPTEKFELSLPLRPYQQVAATLALKTGGLLIADEVGLGKTAASIGLFTDPRTLPAVVVTLTHLPWQWEREINRFAPDLKTHVIKQGAFYKIVTKKKTFPDVVILNYHKLSKWAPYFKNHIRSVIFDEIQELRRGTLSQKGAAAFFLAKFAAFRVGLSATPSYNYGGEMYSIIEAVKPGLLGTQAEFAREWLDWRGKGLKDPKAFGYHLRDQGIMLRRTREDVCRELPSLTKIPHHIDFDFDALDSLSSSADELALTIARSKDYLKQTEKFGTEREFEQVLRQLTGIGKAPYVAEFVRLLLETGEQVVLYGWHREVYSIWLDRLAEYEPAMYTGSETPTRKNREFERFITKETPLLIISLRSGAGLDGLQHHCRTVVIGELDWSPAVHDQCIGRVHRDGQLDPVKAYFLLSNGGSDPFIASILGIKKTQIEGVKDPDGAVLPNYDLAGVNIKGLAKAYLRQRKKKVRAMAKKFKPWRPPLKNRYRKGLGSLTLKEMEKEFISFTRTTDYRTIIDQEMVQELGNRLGVEIPRKVQKVFAKRFCKILWEAACRCRTEERDVLQTSDV